MCLIKCQSHTLIHDRTQWKHCNPEIVKNVKSVNLEWDQKFYFRHLKSMTLKHPETINDNVENLSKRIENER